MRYCCINQELTSWENSLQSDPIFSEKTQRYQSNKGLFIQEVTLFSVNIFLILLLLLFQFFKNMFLRTFFIFFRTITVISILQKLFFYSNFFLLFDANFPTILMLAKLTFKVA
jgi:hypothetical protein